MKKTTEKAQTQQLVTLYGARIGGALRVNSLSRSPVAVKAYVRGMNRLRSPDQPSAMVVTVTVAIVDERPGIAVTDRRAS